MEKLQVVTSPFHFRFPGNYIADHICLYFLKLFMVPTPFGIQWFCGRRALVTSTKIVSLGSTGSYLFRNILPQYASIFNDRRNDVRTITWRVMDCTDLGGCRLLYSICYFGSFLRVNVCTDAIINCTFGGFCCIKRSNIRTSDSGCFSLYESCRAPNRSPVRRLPYFLCFALSAIILAICF